MKRKMFFIFLLFVFLFFIWNFINKKKSSFSVSAQTENINVSSTCLKKFQGDANCDGSINNLDFNIWKCEFLGGGSCNTPSSSKTADFNRDRKINLIDFEIWRQGSYSDTSIEIITPFFSPTVQPTSLTPILTPTISYLCSTDQECEYCGRNCMSIVNFPRPCPKIAVVGSSCICVQGSCKSVSNTPTLMPTISPTLTLTPNITNCSDCGFLNNKFCPSICTSNGRRCKYELVTC